MASFIHRFGDGSPIKGLMLLRDMQLLETLKHAKPRHLYAKYSEGFPAYVTSIGGHYCLYFSDRGIQAPGIEMKAYRTVGQNLLRLESSHTGPDIVKHC